MKKIAMAIAISALLVGTANAQIPVTDAASIAESVTQHAEDIAKWVEQREGMVQQLTQMQQQYASLTGSRNLGEIFNNAKLREYLPTEWQQVYDSVKSGGYSGLSGEASKIFNQNHVFDACASISDATMKKSCEAMSTKPAQDKANAMAAFDATKKRLQQIDQLRAQINTTQDPKAIAELQARIAAEQATINNMDTQIKLFGMLAQAEDRLQEQRLRETNAKLAARKGYPTMPQVNFGSSSN